MRRIRLLAAVAVVAVLALGGCKGKQGTPKGLLEKMHEACVKMDTAAMAECAEPDAQKVMKEFLPVMTDVMKAAKDAAAAVEKKIGKEQAKDLDGMTGKGGAEMSPVKGAVKDGKVDWAKVKITEDGDKATVEVDGKKLNDELKKVGGKWYMAVPEKDRPSAEDVKKQVEASKKTVAGLKEFTKKVNDGKVTKDNIAEELAKAMSGS